VSEPHTLGQWQDAVDAAQGCLASELVRALGFTSGGPLVDVARCAQMIEEGRERGVTPSENAIKDWFAETTNELDTERIYRVFLKTHEMSGHPDLASVVPFLTQ